MVVDRQSWVESTLMSIRGRLANPGMLYIGGYDGSLPFHLAALSGFHGCMKKVGRNSYSIKHVFLHQSHQRALVGNVT
ncbi:unnamed protein product [Heligmosomoides polygyrus]|uniref:DUF2156 domain-containing protein n=1 Tax=Heligmosomoides polygyrus TaxID=6339 RepID=A0A183GFQ4_HELPZ|nr:unnamed protein product [Heligmosomoides polygyrus]